MLQGRHAQIWARQGPIFYPNFFWLVVYYKSISKPKIYARPRPWGPCQPWRPCVCSSKANSYYGQQLPFTVHYGSIGGLHTTYCSATAPVQKNKFLSSLLLLLLLISVFESFAEILALWILRILDIENNDGLVKVPYPLYTYTRITRTLDSGRNVNIIWGRP